MGMQIENSLLLTQALDQGVEWTPQGGVAATHVPAGNYGNIESACIDGGTLVVKTDKGTLRIDSSCPQLDDMKEELSAEGFLQLGQRFPDTAVGLNMFAVMQLIHESAREEKLAAREARKADADVAFQSGMAAASEIREGAALALAGAIVSGVMNIAMGAVSLGMAAKSIGANKEMSGLEENISVKEDEVGGMEQEKVQTTRDSMEAAQLDREIANTKAEKQQFTEQIEAANAEVVRLKSLEKSPENEAAIMMKEEEVESLKVDLGKRTTKLDALTAERSKLPEMNAQETQLKQDELSLRIKAREAEKTELVSQLKGVERNLKVSQERVAGLNKLVEGLSGMMRGAFDYGKELSDAKAKEDEALSDAAHTWTEDESQFIGQYQKMLDDVRQAIQDMNDSYNRTMESITRA